MKKISKFSLTMVCFLFLSSCAPTIVSHGYTPSETEISQIVVGSDTIDVVEEVFGRPTSQGVLEDRAWYYVSSKVSHYTYHPAKVVERKVLAVDFDANGVVIAVIEYGIKDGYIVNLNTQITETGGKRLTALQQIFGNLGNVDPAAFLK